jgi:lysophospholipase L1-like esterase
MNFKFQHFVLLLFCVLLSCTSDDYAPIDYTSEEEPEEIEEPIGIQEPIKYLALGDSYTIGQGVEESERWPNQLIVELETNDFTVENSEIIAQTGWRTSNLINAIDNSNPQDFNLVSLLIGVNNQFNNQNFDVFISEFNELLQKSISIAGNSGRVFVVSIPDYGVTPFGNSWGNPEQIASELDAYNNYMMQRCAELNIPFINITEISRDLGDSEGALASDNLHPSGAQYTLWVEEILPVVLELITD